MRTDNRSLVLATLGGLSTALACTLITDVDRQKIKPPTPQGEGGETATGGSSGRGGQGGKAGRGGDGGSSGTGTAGTAPQGGQAGEGGAPGTGGTSGVGGSVTGGTGGTGDPGGAGGEAGAPAICGNGVMESGEACDDGNTASCGTCSADCSAPRSIPAGEDASITIGAGTNIADGDTFTISDGANTVVFEFECDPVGNCPGAVDGVASGNVEVPFNATYFDGMTDEAEYRDLIMDAIDSSVLATNPTDGGDAPAVVALSGVETLTDTVGAPTFVPAVRCRANRGCSGDNVCLSDSCTTAVCD